MFKLFILITCDLCGEPFQNVALSSDRNPHSWEYLLPRLEYTAERLGWDLYHRHWCYDCVEEASTEASSTQQPDDDCPF